MSHEVLCSVEHSLSSDQWARSHFVFICICVRRCCRPAFGFDSACSRAVSSRALADHPAQRASVHQREIWLHVQPHATQIWHHPPLAQICRLSPCQSPKDHPYTWGETHTHQECLLIFKVTVPGSDCSGYPERVQLSKLISSEIILCCAGLWRL